ncbi:MAG: sporulation protein YtfJ [Clostridia bacterium]|nr:sporulation protein YtfJ [Clostridia bacterium]
MNDIIKATMEGIRAITDMDTVVGGAITTPQGVTVIPISKVTMGVATGGVDLGAKKFSGSQNFGGGGGTGLSITPVAFLAIGRDAEVKLVHLGESDGDVERVCGIIEKSPEILGKIKDALF